MTQKIIDTGAQPDDGQGDPLRTAFSYTNDNFTEIYTAGPVGSNVRIANNTITTTVINSDLVLSPSGIGKIQVNNNVLPRSDDVYELGSSTQRFNAIYLGTGGLNSNGIITTTGNISAGYFIGDGSLLTGITANAGSKLSNGTSNINIPSSGSNIIVSVSGTANVVTFSNTGAYIIGTVSATGNISGDYILGNGALLTGLNNNYSNANVATYLPTYTGNLVSLTGPIITTANITSGNVATGNVRAGNINASRAISATGNVTGSYFIGDGSQLTNLPVSNYSNSNVEAYLPTYSGNLVSLTGPVITTANVTGGNLQTAGTISATGNITGGNVATGRVNAGNVTVSGPISATGNITGSYFIGNGSQLTGIVTNYSNANVAAYLPTYTGNLASLTGPVITTANIVGSNVLATGVISTAGNITGGNVATGRVNAGNVTVSGPISATGNITGSYFIGDGSQLTNLPAGNYSNANVAAYLPTYTGNLVSLTGPVITTSSIAGSSLSIVGNITGGNVDTGRVNAGNITVSGPVSATGNITGSYFIGDGSLLTNLPAGNYSNANVANFLPTYTGNLVSLTGPVVTTSNVTGGNLKTAGTISATGNIIGGNVDTGRVNAGNVTVSGPVSATGNITGSYFIGDGSLLTNLPAGNYSNANVASYLPTYTGNLVSLTGPVVTTSSIAGANLSIVGNITGGNVDTGRVNAGNVTVSGPVSATGNITGSYFIGNGSLLTGLPATYSNANVATYLPTYTGNLVSLTGPVVTTANVTGGNLRTSGLISATGNITSGNVDTGNVTAGNVSAFGNVISTYFIGDGSFLTNLPSGNYSNANVASYLPIYTGNLTSLTGPVITTGNIIGSNLITSGTISAVGNITGGNVDTGRVNAGNVTVSGPVSAVGNISGAYFIGDGSFLTNLPAGNYSNANVANYLPTYTGNLVSLTGPVVTTSNVTGGNLKTAGIISATGNITGGNVDTGNVTADNVSAFGNVIGTYFIGDGSQLTNLPAGNYSNANVANYLPTYTGNLVSLTGPVVTTANVTGGNLRTAGAITATGNITGNNVNTNTVVANAVLSAGIISTAGNVIGNNLIGSQIIGTTISAIANITGGNLRTAGTISATGNIIGGNFNAPGGTFAGYIVSVNGTVTGGNLTTLGIVSAFGNITGGNMDTGNIHAGNIISNATITAIGNIYTSQYFIGNGKFLTGLDTYSNANVAAFLPTYTGNLVSLTGPVITTANIVGANITASGLISAAGTITSAANITGSNLITSGLVTATGNVTAGNLITTGLAAITGNVTGGNISTAGQVSAAGNITGSNIRASGSISASGNIVTNGSLTLGNTGKINFGTTGSNIYLVNLSPTTLLINAEKVDFTGSEVTAASITGGNVNAPNNLNAGNVLANGVISSSGNIYASNLQVSGTFAVTSLNTTGNINAGNLRTTGQITATGNIIGSNLLTNSQVSAAGNITGNYFIGNGSLLTGIVVSGGTSIDNGNSNVKVGAVNSNITVSVSAVSNVAVFSPTGVSVLGNVAGTFLLGNGAFITGVATAGTATSVANGTSNINIPTTNGNVVVAVAGIGNSAVFTTYGLSLLGNVSGNYIYGNGAFLTGLAETYGNANVADYLPTYDGGMSSMTGLVSTTGNVSAGEYVFGNGIFLTGLPAGYSNANVANYMPTYSGNLPSLTGLVSTTGNVSGNYILGNGALLTGVITSVANINNGSSNINIATSGGNITVGVGGTSNIVVWSTTGQYVTGVISATGNITGSNLITGGLISATSNITGGNVLTSGLVSATSNIVGGNILTGGVISAAGNVDGGNLRTAGLVSATGNISGNYFIGNGSQLTGVSASSVNANALVGNTLSSNVLYSSLTSVGTLGNLSVTGNIDAGNLRTAGQVTSTGNITGGNVLTAGIVSATANVIGGNVLTAGIVSATANVIGGNVLTSGLVSATANITGGNVLTAGIVSATANVIGGNLVTGGKLNIVGTVIGNLIPDADQVYDLGGPGAAWKDLYLSGFSLILGNTTLTSNTTTLTVSNSLSATNVTASGFVTATGNITGSNLRTAGLVTATGNITGGNIRTVGLVTATGNITGGNILTAGLVSATGNVDAGNIRTAGLITATGNIDGGNIRTAGLVTATGNVDAGNIRTIGLITATGNIDGGNIQTAGLVTATGNVSGNNIFATGFASVIGNVITSNVNASSIRPVSGELTITTATGNLNLQPAGNIVLANTYINSVAYPAQDTDAATKLYVDNMVSTALAYHQPVSAATTTDLATATGGSITYAQPNGAANGIGATLTTTGSFNLIDTANVQTVGTRILIQNEGNIVFNGVYTWSNTAAIVRSTDADQYGPDSAEALSLNDYFFVQNGTVNKGAAFVVSAPVGTITFGTSGIVFSQFSSSQTYTANTNAGISLTGTQFNTKVDNDTTAFDAGGNIIVKAGANLTTPNIGAATGTSLSLVGNAISGNVLTGGVISSTGNITSGNITTAGAITATGNITGNYFIGNGSQLTGVIAAGGVGNTITLGTPTDSNLVANGAYQGWTTGTFVTDGLDDLNQVAFNIANSTYVGNTYITANVYSGPSPLSVSFTGRYIGNPNSYLWQFGDGTSNVTTANAIHTFSNALGGTFTVSFTAYNTNGTFNGNVANGAKGSTSTASISNIVLYTPSPIPSFTLSSNSFNSGNSVTVTNTSQYVTWYDLSFGDGTSNFAAGPGLGNTSFTTVNHTYNSAAANTDSLYSVILSGTSNTAGASNVTVVSSASNVKSYSSQDSNVFVTANVITVINGLGIVSFRNDSTGAPGNTASFGSQQLYNYNYGDGNVANVNVGTGIAGNPSAANVTNTFALSGANQAANAYQQFTANLFLYTGFSTSPAKSSNITISVNPQVRANFIGATANTTTDATANTGNARVGYIYTDYTGNDRATFTFQNTSQNSNLANWSWGDSTFSNGVSNVGNTLHTYTSTGAKTVALTANGTPNGISSTAQSNTSSITGYIFIATNPTAPTNLSGFANLTVANTSEGTSPLLAAGARDATGGNIVANGASVTRFAATTTIATAANIVNANTATTGTLSAYVNNNISGNVTFTTNGNTVGSNAALVISADRDLHVANAAVPSYFYKVFNANVSCALSSLGTGYNNYKLVHTVSGNTNYVGFVKDNLNTAPSLVTGNIIIVEGTAGTYRYISGIPYYNTGSPTVTIANLAVANLSGQTFRSADPFVLASGTVSEGLGALVSATQTKSLSTINNSGNSFLTSANLNANVGIASNYAFGNMTANLTGANNVVATLQANIFNVVGTSTTVQLPANIQMYAGANSGMNEQAITASTTGNVQAAIRVVMSTAGNTPVFSNSTNFYTANAWSGAQTIAGTPEAVVRYGVLKQYAVDLSTGYLPVGPNLSVTGGRTSTQYFTFAFARPSLANFDIRITSATGIAGVWIAAPGTTIDKSGFTSPTPGFPGPTSTINGWLEASTQYAGSGVPGASGTGGNGSNGCALTGADVIPLNTAISNVAYTMTLGSQNAANSTGTNILIRIALASGQTISDLQIGTAT